MSREDLKRQLEYFQDLGVKDLVRRKAPAVIPMAIENSPVEIALPGMAPSDDNLEKIFGDIGDCKRCKLHVGRNKIVFGTGNPEAKLVFVGEGPGADEDESGIPFVGRAGQLLTQMIDGTSAKEGFEIRRGIEKYIIRTSHSPGRKFKIFPDFAKRAAVITGKNH